MSPYRFENPSTGKPVTTSAEYQQAAEDLVSLSAGAQRPFEDETAQPDAGTTDEVQEPTSALGSEAIGPSQLSLRDQPLTPRETTAFEDLGRTHISRGEHFDLLRAMNKLNAHKSPRDKSKISPEQPNKPGKTPGYYLRQKQAGQTTSEL